MEKTNLKQQIIKIITFVLLGVVATSLPVAAASPWGAGFHVRANLPENQIDETLSYFDLRMQPLATQQLEVEITNNESTAIIINVAAITASSNHNGIIDYKTPDIQDETLAIPFSSITTVSEPTMIIPANSSKNALFTIVMPENSFDGVILGGLVFTRESEADKPTDSTTINNAFSYVIGVKLSESDVEVVPQFELINVTPNVMNYRPAFTHAIRNSQAVIVKDMTVEISLLDSKNNIYAQLSKEYVDMAPNSTMNLGVFPLNEKIIAGDYTTNVTLKYDDELFKFQTTFTVFDANIAQIEKDSITISETTDNNHFHLIIILLLVIIFYLIYFIIKKNNRQNHHNIDDRKEDIDD